MADLLSSWLLRRAWHSQVFHDEENERDQTQIGLIFGGILCTLSVVHDHSGYVRCSLVPGFNLDIWKTEQAKELFKLIGSDAFRMFHDAKGYVKIGVRVLRCLREDPHGIDFVDQAANDAIATLSAWVDDLRTFCTTNAGVDTILEARANLPTPPLPAFRVVIDRDSFELICENHSASKTSKARSFMDALWQSQEQRDELRRDLEAQGFVIR